MMRGYLSDLIGFYSISILTLSAVATISFFYGTRGGTSEYLLMFTGPPVFIFSLFEGSFPFNSFQPLFYNIQIFSVCLFYYIALLFPFKQGHKRMGLVMTILHVFLCLVISALLSSPLS